MLVALEDGATSIGMSKGFHNPVKVNQQDYMYPASLCARLLMSS